MPYEQEATTYAFLKQYAEGLLKDVNAGNAFERLAGGGQNPAWIIGHLGLVANHLIKSFGGQPNVDVEEWSKRFGGGSDVPSEPGDGPDWDAIVAAWRDAQPELLRLAGTVTKEMRKAPNTMPVLKDGLATMGDFFSFVLTGHEALHLGQLSAWRRAQGKAQIF